MEIDFGVSALDDYDEDDHPQIATDSPATEADEGTQPAERLMPKGFYSRNLDPDKGATGDNQVGLGAGVLVITIGDRRYVLPLNDPRDVGKIPKLRKGGAMMAGGAGDHRSFLMVEGEDPDGEKKAGTVMISASYGPADAKKSLGISLNVRDEGEEEVTIVHGDGMRITLGDNSVTISNAAGDSYIQVGPDGPVLAGSTTAQGSVVVGNVLAAQSVALSPMVFAALMIIAAKMDAAGSAGSASLLSGTTPLIAAFQKLLGANHLKST